MAEFLEDLRDSIEDRLDFVCRNAPVVLAILLVHLAVTVWSYARFGPAKCVVGTVLFTASFALSCFLVLGLTSIALLAAVVAAVYGVFVLHTKGAENPVAQALMVLALGYVVLWLLIVAGPAVVVGLTAA